MIIETDTKTIIPEILQVDIVGATTAIIIETTIITVIGTTTTLTETLTTITDKIILTTMVSADRIIIRITPTTIEIAIKIIIIDELTVTRATKIETINS